MKNNINQTLFGRVTVEYFFDLSLQCRRKVLASWNVCVQWMLCFVVGSSLCIGTLQTKLICNIESDIYCLIQRIFNIDVCFYGLPNTFYVRTFVHLSFSNTGCGCYVYQNNFCIIGHAKRFSNTDNHRLVFLFLLCVYK